MRFLSGLPEHPRITPGPGITMVLESSVPGFGLTNDVGSVERLIFQLHIGDASRQPFDNDTHFQSATAGQDIGARRSQRQVFTGVIALYPECRGFQSARVAVGSRHHQAVARLS